MNTSIEPSNAVVDPRRTIINLAIVGLVAGLFSSMFGVGGGIVMVPLLIVLLGFDAKIATATSLAAIIYTAVWGTLAHGLLGNVDWAMAALVGIPATLGVSAGVALKGRLSSKNLTYAFAGLLVAVAVRLVFA